MTARSVPRELIIQHSRDRLDALKIQFEGGDDFALLSAIRECANFDLVMPDWVAQNYIRRFDRVLNCHVKSWDEAFGKPYAKGAHIAALRQHRTLRLAILSRIRQVRAMEPDTPIDDGLFERVGAEFGIGKTTCSELYYQADRMFPKVTSAKF
jgi:hypothetical protein